MLWQPHLSASSGRFSEKQQKQSYQVFVANLSELFSCFDSAAVSISQGLPKVVLSPLIESGILRIVPTNCKRRLSC